MDDKEKSNCIARDYESALIWREDEQSFCDVISNACIDMANWKNEQIWLLIDAIDHAYLKTDGTYGDLSYEVSDKVKYLKSILK